MEAFQPFSLTHTAALLTIAAATWALVAYGRRHRSESAPSALETQLAIVNLALWTLAHGWWNLPPRFDPAITLPLQMCHLASVIASLVLLTRVHLFRVLLYFWGIGLSTQALLTPTLQDPPSTLWFWAFWFQHGFIMTIVVYDLVVHRFRPTWRDYGVACAASAAYLAVVLPLDVALGANYGFLGDSKPGTPSIVDLLGPWPGRVAIIVALVAAVMALLMLPWEIARYRARRCSRGAGAPKLS